MNSRSYKRRIISANQQTAQSSNTTTHKGEGKLRIVSPASAEEKQARVDGIYRPFQAAVAQEIVRRKALFDQLADRNGRHMIPYTQRMAIGSVRRGEGGTDAAPYPKEWSVEPNRPDRLDDVLPDSKAKQAARDRGVPFFPYPTLGQKDAAPEKKN